ncbi:hypothetical protein [Piscirickettsia litoralis]|uniref:Uncharacterized protein n=1 Tax=Piscirickettsia litoralis TaxID=1891921 RepID=A0ABX3A510_9GAMM|nr:hypothetical protein [Piscirickettsia litoralis]ODN42728.1 hypothetical protein BGC07_07075 [Piscirickettsia litoralis]
MLQIKSISLSHPCYEIITMLNEKGDELTLPIHQLLTSEWFKKLDQDSSQTILALYEESRRKVIH